MINKEYVLEFTKKILSIDSPSGFTKNIINFLVSECESRNLDFYKNNKGNLFINFPGESNYTVGLSAHVDTLGAMVRSIKGDGTLAFTTIGGPILPTYDGEYCKIYTRDGKVYTGTFLSNAPAIHVYDKARTLERNTDNMHIRLDEVVKTKDDVLKLGINSGDFIAIDPKTVITKNDFIKSRFLDDKISVGILFGLIDYLQKNKVTPKQSLKIIISTFEEVGHGASNIPEVDELISVDMGCIGLDLNCTEYDVSICAKDSSGPYDYDITTNLIEICKKMNINYAVDIYPFYSSDASAALRAGNNIKAALIGPGVSASHGMERTHWHAVLNTLKLLIAYITKNSND
ncbi:MAG TPA: M42 family metallopeptidase [Acholeplasmataceae bacterium]|jgi:putative aminopeptidase FrvX|nr:M42 family metallopeptidase [Acholeplasmataceae bacterium]